MWFQKPYSNIQLKYFYLRVQTRLKQVSTHRRNTTNPQPPSQFKDEPLWYHKCNTLKLNYQIYYKPIKGLA